MKNTINAMHGDVASGTLNSHGGAGGFDSVFAAVDGALTTMNAAAGASAVALVRRTLAGAPGIDAVDGTLAELEPLLGAGAVDGPAVGQLLTRLSMQTREVASGAGPLTGVLHQLAVRLDDLGAKLSGA